MEKEILFKMVVMATTYSFSRYCFIVLTPTLPALLQNKIGQLNNQGATVFCFGLCHEFKFWQLTIIFSAFYRLYLEITIFYTTPSCQITSRKLSFTVNSTKRWTPLKSCINRLVFWYRETFCLLGVFPNSLFSCCFPLRFLSFSRVD